MARKLRVQYPGAIDYVMSRWDRRGRIFLDDQDRREFLETLGEACQKTGWQMHAYCLTDNEERKRRGWDRIEAAPETRQAAASRESRS